MVPAEKAGTFFYFFATALIALTAIVVSCTALESALLRWYRARTDLRRGWGTGIKSVFLFSLKLLSMIFSYE